MKLSGTKQVQHSVAPRQRAFHTVAAHVGNLITRCAEAELLKPREHMGESKLQGCNIDNNAVVVQLTTCTRWRSWRGGVVQLLVAEAGLALLCSRVQSKWVSQGLLGSSLALGQLQSPRQGQSACSLCSVSVCEAEQHIVCARVCQ
eukprot:1125-Heterococcus_DN1.PRE.5